MEIKLNLIKEEQEKFNKHPVLSNQEKVLECIRELWESFPEYDKGRENMFILYLDIKNVLISIELHAQGTIDQAMIYPREIIRKGLHVNCAGIVLVHNHPSGCVNPSGHDFKITETLKPITKLMDINILDHIIINNVDNKYYSMQTEGKI